MVSQFQEANQLQRSGKLEEAVIAYRSAIASYPDFYWSYHNLGETLTQLGRLDEAVEAYQKAVELNPQKAWCLYKLGELFLLTQQFEKAVDYLRQAVDLKSDIVEFYLALGAALVKSGECSKGELCLYQVIQFPSSSTPNSYKAEAFYCLGVAKSKQQQWLVAVEWYRRALEMNPSTIECLLALAQALEELGYDSEAKNCYWQVAVLSGESVKGGVESEENWLERLNQLLGELPPISSVLSSLRDDRTVEKVKADRSDLNLNHKKLAKTKPIQNKDYSSLHKKKILYIIHDGGGGMVHTSLDLLKSISKRTSSFLLKAGRKKWEVLHAVKNEIIHQHEYNFKQDWSTINDIDSERREALEDLCQKLKPSLVHLRVLLGTGPSVIDFFKDKQIPIVFSFHDFSAICPSIHLINNGDFCFGDCQKYDHEKDCKHLKSWFSKSIKVRPNYRNLWSETVIHSLYKCDAYVVTANFTKEVILSNYPMLSQQKFHNIEHGRDVFKRYKVPDKYNHNGAYDLVFFGALNEEKGCSLVLEIVKINDDLKGPLKFHIVGNIFSKAYVKEFSKSKSVVLYGYYERNEITHIFKKIQPKLAILPSIWPETYSHTLTESWIHGIPVLGTSYGAIGERIRHHDGGWTLDPVDPHQWYEKILSIMQDQEEYFRKIANIEKISIKTVDQMTDDYCDLYINILKYYRDNPFKSNHKIADQVKVSTTKTPIKITSEKTKPNVRHLKLKLLEVGFIDRAHDELLSILKDGSNGYFSKQASWELAVWYANQYNREATSECLKMLTIATKNEKEPEKLSRAKLLEVECYDRIGDLVTGKKLIQHALRDSPNADLYLAAANLENSISQRLEYINKALELLGVSEIILTSHQNQHPFDCLIPSLPKPELYQSTHSNPKVTVIVPAFNAEETINTALNALLYQTWTNLEILVVDDCSTDNTTKLVENYAKQDSRIRLIRADKNQGPYVSRNLALQQASGEFVTCHDADDWSHSEKIEIQVKHLLKNPKSLANISSWTRTTNDLKFYRRGNPGFYIQLNISSLMFRRHPIMEKLGYWDSVRFGADSELITRIKQVFGNQTVEEIPAILSLGRSAEHSLTENSSFGYPGFPMGARKEYRDSYLHYHSTGNELKYQFPQTQRPFSVPEVMMPIQETTSGTRRYLKVIFAHDFRIWDRNTARVVEEIKNYTNLGTQVGVVQMSVYDVNPNQKIDSRVRVLLDSENTQMIVYGEKIDCDELIISHLSILEEKQRYIPDIKADQVNVIIDIELESKNLSEIASINFKRCVKHLQEYFGRIGVWYPMNDQVRSLLAQHCLDQLKHITLSQENWKFSKAGGMIQNYTLCFDTDKESYVEIPHDESFNIVDELTLEFLISLNKWPKNWTSVIKKGWDEKNSEFDFRIRGEDIGQFIYGTGTDIVHLNFMPGNHMRLGEWTHIGIVRKVDHYIRIYINGVLCHEKKTGILKSVKTDADVFLMANPKRNSFLSGQLRDLGIWDIARSHEDMLADINGKITGKEQNLVGYWKFNEGYGQFVNNHVEGSYNQAILHNAEWLKSPLDYPLISQSIELIDVKNINSFTYNDDQGVTIIMPCIDTKKAMETAYILSRRAGMYCKILVVYDTLRQGFIKTLNDTAARVACRYIVYLAEDAFPGRNWLRSAYESLEKSGKGLLAFNDGKWSGKIASFGMVRTDWVKTLYNGKVFCPHYRSHAADNELTVIARALGMHLYNPECTLVEHDFKKDFAGSNPQDYEIFKQRFLEGFDSLISLDKVRELSMDYRVKYP
jgi:tetratricopeptide (TPR) repeat protein